MPRTTSASGTSAPGLDLGAGGAQLVGERVDGHLARIGAQRDRRGFVHRDQRGTRVAGAELGGEALDQPVGVRQRDRVVAPAPGTAAAAA